MPTADEIEREVGHPGDRWDSLKERVQREGITEFSTVEAEFLALIWCLDQYRVHGVAPLRMGNTSVSERRRLEAVYRSKGNWFADLIALLLDNRTHSRLAPRSSVQGFSQTHQIDVAWPARSVDPLICAETKMTGAPAFDGTPARGALADWTNRRKELKFAATDLKLYRRQNDTQIDHWDTWRKQQPPLTFLLWAARLRPNDSLETIVAELRAINETYLDGAGLFAYRERRDGAGYEPVPLSQRDRTVRLDNVLHLIANQINIQAPGGQVPPPQVPPKRATDVASLVPDELAD